MQIKQITSVQNFGRVFVFSKVLNELKANGSSKSEIEALKKYSLWGRSARLINNQGNGYYLASSGHFYFLGNKPTASDVMAQIEFLNHTS